MSDVAIRVEGLGKRYRIGAMQGPYRTVRETLVVAARLPPSARPKLRPCANNL